MTTQKRNNEASEKTRHRKGNGKVLAAGLLIALLLTGLIIRLDPLADQAGEQIVVYKSPDCGCCDKWIQHLRDAGFQVTFVKKDEINAVKTLLGVPADMQSCHTALVGGYVVEGHVPAADIKRLLAERPDVAGIAVPGMPMGSPGMEMPGHQGVGYQVLAFDKEDNMEVFARH